MPQATACPSPETLRRIAQTSIYEAADSETSEHLRQCPACFRAVQRLRNTTTLPTESPTPDDALAATSLDAVKVASADTLRPNPLTGDEPTAESYEFLSPPQQAGEIGRLGKYRVLKLLGEGGMGMVFQAEDSLLDRVVALKVMKPERSANELTRRRFLQEAKAVAQLQHDNIVTIYQIEEERGVLYMAMQFLTGEPLDRRLKREGRLKTEDVLAIGRQIADGLAAAHQRGLVHRDIKPANLWLEPAAGGVRVKILDFGLARTVGEENQNLTKTGAVMGTPGYMAPEQARGWKVDFRCDLFSLGCVLYRMCTGREPFRGEDIMATLTALATEDPPPIRDLNPDVPHFLVEMIMKLLAKEPGQRPVSARLVSETLTTAARTLGKGPAAAPPPARPAITPLRPGVSPFAPAAPRPREADTEPPSREPTTPVPAAPAQARLNRIAVPPAKPRVDDLTGPCPKCGASRARATMPGWCMACGYHPELDRKVEIARPEQSNTWIWIWVGGFMLVVAASIIGNIVMKKQCEARAWWGVTQLGVGVLLFLVAEVWGFFYTLNHGQKLSFMLPVELWAIIARSLPASRYPVWLGTWSFTAAICAVLVIGGQFYWIDRMKSKYVRRASTGAYVKETKTDGNEVDDAAEDFVNEIDRDYSADIDNKDKDKDLDEDDGRHYVERYVIVGYVRDEDGKVTELVLAEQVGKDLFPAGTVSRGISQEDMEKVLALKRQPRSALGPTNTLAATWVEPTESVYIDFTGKFDNGILKDGYFKGWKK